MGRSIASVLTGLAIGILIIAILQWAGMQVYPPSATLGVADADTMVTPPVGALAMTWVAWFFGAVDAAILSAWLAPGKPWRHAVIVTGLLFGLALLNLASMPYPQWFMVATPLVFLMAALVGGKVGSMMFDRRQIGVAR